jgi:phenylalanyl-tRNA synthetase alpha chain
LAPELSLAERRLLLALPKDGAGVAANAVPGFANEGEALQAAGGLQRAGLVELKESAASLHALTTEGQRIHAAGLPEWRAAKHLREHGAAAVADVQRNANLSDSEAKVIVGVMKRNGWADIERAGGGLLLKPTSLPASYPLDATFRSLSQVPRAIPVGPEIAQLIERGLVQAVQAKSRTLQLTPAGIALAKTLKPDEAGATEVNQLTSELVAAWATMSPAEKAKTRLRPFDFAVDVAVPAPGKEHPLTHIINEIRDIFVALGFQEIAGDYVEPAFWNMDALFIPQDHPSR